MTAFNIDRNSNVGILIDGPAFNAACMGIGIPCDFDLLLGLVEEESHLAWARFHTPAPAERAKAPALVEAARQAGLSVVESPACVLSDPQGRTRFLSNNAASLAADIADAAGRLDTLILFSDDIALTRAVGLASGRGLTVIVVARRRQQDAGSGSGQWSHAGLVDAASEFVALEDLLPLLSDSGGSKAADRQSCRVFDLAAVRERRRKA